MESAERINRVGPLLPYGYAQYIQEVKRVMHKTVEKALVYIYEAPEMPDSRGERINYLV